MLPELIEWRRDLHRQPELMYDLPRTSRLVAARLRAFGFDAVPAEEGGVGAEAMINDGMLDHFPVKGAYGLHNWPGMPVGAFGAVRGAAMASTENSLIVSRERAATPPCRT